MVISGSIERSACNRAEIRPVRVHLDCPDPGGQSAVSGASHLFALDVGDLVGERWRKLGAGYFGAISMLRRYCPGNFIRRAAGIGTDAGSRAVREPR